MIAFRGTAYRMVFVGQDPMAPVRSPEGRFHRPGQSAVYTSLSPEGTEVAMRRYFGPHDPPRHIVPLKLDLKKVCDQRGAAAATVVWQTFRDKGQVAPTWVLSDAARAEGAQGLFYSSRSRPDLTHLVVFDITPATLTVFGTPIPFAG